MNPSQKTKSTKWMYCILIVIGFLVPYAIVNHLPLDRYTISFILGEERVPFLPWTFIVYISAFIQGAIIIRHAPPKFLPRAVFIASCMLLVGIMFFLLLPIEYPRSLYPNTNSLINFFRQTDAAGNCLPSLHVAMTIFLTSYYTLFEKSLLRKSLMWLWTVAIIISVLTTKQHYLVDIFGGIVLTIPFVTLLRKKISL